MLTIIFVNLNKKNPKYQISYTVSGEDSLSIFSDERVVE